MSEELPPINNAQSFETPAGSRAENYIVDELAKARVTLQRTQIIGIVSTFLVLAYMGYITVGLRQYLEPTSAAEMANGMISQRVAEQGPELADQVRQQIPVMIAQIPDYAQQQMPILRENLEAKFESSLTDNCNSVSKQTDDNITQYLTDHKDEMKSALASGQDSGAVKQLGDGVTQQFLTTLKTTPAGGSESVQDKINKSLAALSSIQQKMDRLANGANLTPQEKKTRHMIAVMTKTIETQTPKGVQVSSIVSQ